MIEYNFILEGKNEFYKKINNKKYYILLANDDDKINYMIKIFNEFISNKKKENSFNINKYIGMDFEFKSVSKIEKKIALFQINLEDESANAYIFIFYPPQLKKEDNDILIKLLTSKNIIKILHGGEALDIPYLYNDLFKNDKKIINKFSKNLFDTKYLCEFYHIENKISNKCSIYNLLYEFKIISQKKFNFLNSIEYITGPIYTITFDIDKLTNELIQYAFYDVLFLPTLLKKFISISNIYTKIIPELSTIIFFYKRNIDDNFNLIDDAIKKYNNYFIIINDEKIKLIDLYYFALYFVNYNSLIHQLLEITYFKYFLQIILKYIVYIYIQKNYIIFISKNNKLKDNILPTNCNILKKNKNITNIFFEFKKNILNFI